MKSSVTNNYKTIYNGVILLLTIAFIMYGFKTNLFSSQLVIESFLKRFGILAPFVLVLIQAFQVVFPILPGGIGLLVGVLIFGPLQGFIYNYIGICIGSIMAFLLSKKYGTYLIEKLFSNKLKDKYKSWTSNKNFEKLFTIAIFMPVAPDDFLCYLAGTSSMKLSRFSTIIFLGKPLAIAAYTFGLSFGFNQLISLIH
ncbi:MAG: TVP38/TMEM64 family protein [Spirochaetaceae bacterium]|nr:TVP38/TMEM64 family protein [Spirochaetaceae bacterium]